MSISGASSCSPALQQGHSDTRILAEARRKHASGRTSPHYYVIEFLSCVHDGSGYPLTLRNVDAARSENFTASGRSLRGRMQAYTKALKSVTALPTIRFCISRVPS
jgi:hypothetical protein